MERGIARGYSREALENLWQHLEGFADYAFNKCVGGETRVALVPGGELRTVADLAMGAAGPGPWRTWSWDGSGWVVNEIEDVFPTGVQDVVEVELEDGRRLVCTVDHCFYSWADDTGWGWHPLWKILSLGQPLWGTFCPAAGETTSHIHRTVSADI
jgi:DNA polymerase-3 subunit alpha